MAPLPLLGVPAMMLAVLACSWTDDHTAEVGLIGGVLLLYGVVGPRVTVPRAVHRQAVRAAKDAPPNA